METPEEFILQHSTAVYDPIKAHEYYLKTRQLKGRKTGTVIPSTSSRGTASPKVAPQQPKVIAKVQVKTPEQQRKEVEARVKALKGKLEKLHTILSKLINQAQGRTVVDAKGRQVSGTTPHTKNTPAGSAKTVKPSKLTAAQKDEAAKRAKIYRQKHPQQTSLHDQEARLQAQIKEAEHKIVVIREKLIAAVLRARQTAKTNRQK